MAKFIIIAVLIASLLVAGGAKRMLDKAAGDGKDCRKQDNSVIVNLDNRKYPNILDHTWDAIDGREGQSITSTRDGKTEKALLHIDRSAAEEHRQQSLKGVPTRHGYDRDEYPPAMSREGGKGADVRYVKSAENQGAGSKMGQKLAPYCNGQPFRFEERK